MATQKIRLAGDEIVGVAVAIQRTAGPGTHSGILHRHTNGQLFILHLRWDCDLACEVFKGDFAWVIPDLLPEEVQEIRNVCRAVWRSRPNIHYAFRFDPHATLDRDTGNLISEHAPFGLTCSTFVLAVFNSANVRLIDISSWPSRPEDQIRYQLLFDTLSRRGVDAAHLSRIAQDVQCIRVRPEEVAGACLHTLAPNPPGYAECEKTGRDILAHIKSMAATP